MARVLVVTRATVVIHVLCDAVQPAVGLGFLGPLSSLVALLPRLVAPCFAVCLGKSMVHRRRHQSRDLGGLGIGGGRESTRQFRYVGCGCGGQGRGLGGVFRGDSVEFGQESGGPSCFFRVVLVFLCLVNKEGEFRP